jgi:hypothetical protein
VHFTQRGIHRFPFVLFGEICRVLEPCSLHQFTLTFAANMHTWRVSHA